MTIQKISIIIFAFFAVLAPEAAGADSLVRICAATGNCGVCDVVATAVTLGKWLIAGAAGLALIIIVWASVGFATSGGNPEKIQEAKKQIVWSVLGVGLVFAAFYLVMWVIIAFANPSNQFGYEPNPPDEAVAATGGLGDFLGGTAWWNLCNEAELRANGDQSGSVKNITADCKYWGDGTPCKSDRKSICFGGSCVPVGSSQVQAKITALGGWALPADPTACDYLAAVDRVFENYSCQPIVACNPEKIENGFCSTRNAVCCERKPRTYTPRVRPTREAPSVAPIGEVPTISGDEQTVRQALASAGISINKLPCPDINTSTNCTSVAGLSESTVNNLIDAHDRCNGCIIITGGTEQGPHAQNTTHGRPNVVDIGNSQASRNALDQLGLSRVSSFGDGYAMGSNWYICDTGGQAVACSVASHLHVEF